MTAILLTGAGFTRNWGGWLADEAFEYLLTCRELPPGVIDQLWNFHGMGGFEGALFHYQTILAQTPHKADDSLKRLEAAVRKMFVTMEAGLTHIQFDGTLDVSTFLARFDAIFTLNQDLLLERYYVGHNVSLTNKAKWDGIAIPGLSDDIANPAARIVVPSETARLRIDNRVQPYIKLHGSMNWYEAESNVMVMGGFKAESIESRPILKWGSDRFTEYLNAGDARLMTIGYGFRDEHINTLVECAVSKSNLKLFIVAPEGSDLLRGSMADAFQRAIIGASRRGLRSTFGDERVERQKLDSFFS